MLKNLLRNAVLTATLALFASTSNAALITQDILFDDLTTADVIYETIGSITVESDNADSFGTISTWESFSLFGLDMITEVEANGDFTLFGLFEAVVDDTNLNAGIEFLNFDVTESTWAFYNFSGFYDSFAGGDFVDVFDFGGGVYFFGELALGDASVVSEPSMFFLFFAGLMGLFIKRHKA